MAKQVFTKIVDDLDGNEADETVAFAIDGIAYEIDLSSKHAATLREFLSTYQQAGTRMGRVGQAAQIRSYRSAGTPSVAANREVNQKIRLWAAENGYELNERGRIPQHIVDAYDAGTPHPSKAAADALAAETASRTPAAKRAGRKPAPTAAFQG